MLMDRGFTDVAALLGGYLAWVFANYEIETSP
jgi:rhodanese-related sulfurtransferase